MKTTANYTRNQRVSNYAACLSAHRDGHRHGGQSRGGCDRGVQTLAITPSSSPCRAKRPTAGDGASLSAGRATCSSRPSATDGSASGCLFRAGAAGDGGAGSCGSATHFSFPSTSFPWPRARLPEVTAAQRRKRPPLQTAKTPSATPILPRSPHNRPSIRSRAIGVKPGHRPVHNRIAKANPRRDHGFPARSEPERMHRAGAATARHAVGKGPARHAVGGARGPSL